MVNDVFCILDEVKGKADFPDPMKQRLNYRIINDGWLFSLDGVNWTDINVPYCPQSKLSGVNYTDFIRRCFYKKTFLHEKCQGRVVLHFGAVDHKAVVSLNGEYVGLHIGGFTPFEFDITEWVQEGANEIELVVYDENKNISFGKQSFRQESYGCFYTRVTGIWQSVWLEYRPEKYIKEFYFYPDIEECAVDVEVLTSTSGDCNITVLYDGRIVGDVSAQVECKKKLRIPLSEKHLWGLGEGNLYDVILCFEEDVVCSYFGLRQVEYQGTRFLLNGQEVFQKLVLDQGYNEEGLYTAQKEEDFVRDIEYGIRLGFNGVRLHQKVFEPKYLYYCDKAGYMVWGEYPSWGNDYSNLDGLGIFLSEWQESLKRDFNHPSIIHWCPLNEVWTDWHDAKRKPDIRFIEAVYEFTKKFDPTRPCVDVSGGYHGSKTDLYDFHCYESTEQIEIYLKRLEEEGVLEIPLLSCEGVSTDYSDGQPVNLSEYGGIALREQQVSQNADGDQSSDWGYGKGEHDPEVFVERYCQLTETLLKCKKLSGYCYTQLYDIEQEINGFYFYNRSDKLTEAQKDRISDCQSMR